MKLLMIAAPGGGKGTQGDRLAAKFGVRHISSGDVLRAEVRAGTPAGQQILGTWKWRSCLPTPNLKRFFLCPLARAGLCR